MSKVIQKDVEEEIEEEIEEEVWMEEEVVRPLSFLTERGRCRRRDRRRDRRRAGSNVARGVEKIKIVIVTCFLC